MQTCKAPNNFSGSGTPSLGYPCPIGHIRGGPQGLLCMGRYVVRRAISHALSSLLGRMQLSGADTATSSTGCYSTVTTLSPSPDTHNIHALHCRPGFGHHVGGGWWHVDERRNRPRSRSSWLLHSSPHHCGMYG